MNDKIIEFNKKAHEMKNIWLHFNIPIRKKFKMLTRGIL